MEILELDKICNPEDFSWIKVKQYKKYSNLADWINLRDLEAHHIKETTFLLNTCRELAQELKTKIENE